MKQFTVLILLLTAFLVEAQPSFDPRHGTQHRQPASPSIPLSVPPVTLQPVPIDAVLTVTSGMNTSSVPVTINPLPPPPSAPASLVDFNLPPGTEKTAGFILLVIPFIVNFIKKKYPVDDKFMPLLAPALGMVLVKVAEMTGNGSIPLSVGAGIGFLAIGARSAIKGFTPQTEAVLTAEKDRLYQRLSMIHGKLAKPAVAKPAQPDAQPTATASVTLSAPIIIPAPKP